MTTTRFPSSPSPRSSMSSTFAYNSHMTKREFWIDCFSGSLPSSSSPPPSPLYPRTPPTTPTTLQVPSFPIPTNSPPPRPVSRTGECLPETELALGLTPPETTVAPHSFIGHCLDPFAASNISKKRKNRENDEFAIGPKNEQRPNFPGSSASGGSREHRVIFSASNERTEMYRRSTESLSNNELAYLHPTTQPASHNHFFFTKTMICPHGTHEIQLGYSPSQFYKTGKGFAMLVSPPSSIELITSTVDLRPSYVAYQLYAAQVALAVEETKLQRLAARLTARMSEGEVVDGLERWVLALCRSVVVLEENVRYWGHLTLDLEAMMARGR